MSTRTRGLPRLAGIATLERAIASHLVCGWPASPTGDLANIITTAPDSFDDKQLGKIVATARDMRHAGQAPSVIALKALEGMPGLMLDSLALENAPSGAAEDAAGKIWRAYSFRDAAAGILAAASPLLSDPDPNLEDTLTQLEHYTGHLKRLQDGVKADAFTVWRPSQFMEWTEPPGTHLLKPAFLTRGSLTAIIGQGGLGKSRLTLWLAVCHILGKPWCGLETDGGPSKWLFLGNENGLSRFKTDLSAMFRNLTPQEQATAEEFLRLHAVASFEDGLVDLSSDAACAKLRATVEREQPEVVVVDPLANFVPGDLNKPSDMRDGIRTIAECVRAARPNAAILALHHARTGRMNIAQGVGFDAANFAANAKTLFNACRAVINLMPADEEDDTRLVMACGKASDCQRFTTRGIRFDPTSFRYSEDPDFDLDRWRDDVDGTRTGSSCAIVDVVAAVRNGMRKAGDIIKAVRTSTGAKARTVEKYMKKAVSGGYLETVARGQYILGPNASKV